ncbi:MAG: hypothetical protein CMB47_00560 [Euryarchaeota archaeon]|nr:hypothetical protein [Euryarchaeota archaeon]|tara:strand:+ start:9085 stop:9942 length:858 start_codon:yes stop_codon:yes gene_type:complete
MYDLLQDDLFSSVSDIFLEFSSLVKKSRQKIFLFAPPTLHGALALIPLEAALLDENIPYRRSFSEDNKTSFPCINILKKDILLGSYLENNSSNLTISSKIVNGLSGAHGDRKQGPLNSILQSHALAQTISPSSSRLKYLRPWALSGSWIDASLDNTYDPVFSKIKEILVNEGTIKIVPVTEVKKPYMENYSWIDETALTNLSISWDELDIENKSVLISNLVKPVLNKSLPSTARIEELVWNCVVGNDWQTDLAGQLSILEKSWHLKDGRLHASNLIEKLLIRGYL